MAVPKAVKIVQMGKFFLYLPLYYAEHCDFFGYLPPGFEVGVCWADKDKGHRTDVGAFGEMMDTASRDFSEIEFAICDPTAVYGSALGKSPSPVILAALITSTAFWAVDRKSKTVMVPADLAQFDSIIAYDPGTTSYGIASRVYLEAGKKPSIRSVPKDLEFDTLLKSQRGTVALSPDILNVQEFVWNQARNGFDIDLALGTTPEYTNVLISALVSRSDFVADPRNEQLTLGIIKALQRAMFLVRFGDNDVIQFAHDTFDRIPKERIIRALNYACESQVFPASVEVSRSHWLNAAKAYHYSHGKRYDAQAEKEALNIFAVTAAPYTQWAHRAVQVEILDRLTRDEHPVVQPKQPPVVPVLTGVVVMAIAFVLGWALQGHKILLAGTIIGGGCGLGALFALLWKKKQKSLAGVAYWVLWLTTIVLVTAYLFRGALILRGQAWSELLNIGVIVTFLAAAVGMLASAPAKTN